MAEGMDDKIRQISDMLNSQEAQEGIRQLFNSMNRPSQPHEDTNDEKHEAGQDIMVNPGALSLQNSDWFGDMQNLLTKFSSVEDSRMKLLRSIQPFLNTNRKERCSTCLNVLKVAGMLRAFTNNSGRLL